MTISSASKRIVLVIPVYDDWPSLERLLKSIDDQRGLDGVEFNVLIVNDGSHMAPSIELLAERVFKHVGRIRRVNLIGNLGHQRAIAVGLVTAAKEVGTYGVIIMDSDGEDRPEDVPRLITAAMENPGKIVCARRSKRSDPIGFKVLYLVYKSLFRVLAGESIDFGNFCYIPRSALDSVGYSPSLWNHLAATLVRSRLPLMRIPTERGRRYTGRSRMNLDTLVAHGLTAISVYSDIVLVRIIIGVLGIAAMVTIGLAAVVAIRLFTELATPGWASTVVGSLSIVLLQSVVFALVSTFVLLSARSTKPVIPMIDGPQFIASIESCDPASAEDAIAS